MRPGCLAIIILLLLAAATVDPTGATTLEPLEDLHYRVGFGPWEEMARVHLVLRQTGPDRYLAEFSGAAQGAWRVLRRWLPERYQTEMLVRQGRFQPLVYREEFWNRGTRVVKEYRFDHQENRLELWRQAEGQKQVKKWQVSLKTPVYDPLTIFYNARLGAFGLLPAGGTLRLQGLPNPEPVEWIFRIGPRTQQGQKVMLTLKEKGKESDPYFIVVIPDMVPNQAWARVLLGKLTGTLLNPGAALRQDALTARLSLSHLAGSAGKQAAAF